MKFEDVLQISDQAMGLICRQIPVLTLVRALKTASPEIRQKFLANIRPKFAEMFSDMIAKHEDISHAEVELARSKILEIVRNYQTK